MAKTETQHGTFQVRKDDLMYNGQEHFYFLIKDDELISNGTFLLKENYITINKKLKLDFISYKNFGFSNKSLYDSFKDDLTNLHEHEFVFDETKEHHLFSFLKINHNRYENTLKIDKNTYNKIIKISPDLKFYFHPQYNARVLQIVLNNEIIGLIAVQQM